MNLYPAIDIYDGKVVRLSRGDFNQGKIYAEFPEKQALEWESLGARWIHVVDLEGAKTGELRNFESLLKIRRSVQCFIQFGGGLRSEEAVKKVLDQGIDRVVLGTKALDREFFGKLLSRFGDRIALGLDARDGIVSTEGWLKESGQHVKDVLHDLEGAGLGTVIYTNIKNDGMLEGPDIQGIRDVMSWTSSRVILSGGISGLHDVEACASSLDEDNFEGIIIGKALYEKRLDLRRALDVIAGKGR